MRRGFRAVYECAVPVVCAVNDFCLGTGIGLAGSADIVLAAEGVKFGLPKSTRALGAATHLGRLVPEKHLRWMLYGCEPVSAEQLQEWGTVLDVVPAGELMDRAREIAGVIVSKSAPVIRAAKASLLGIDHAPMTRTASSRGSPTNSICRVTATKPAARSYGASEGELGGR